MRKNRKYVKILRSECWEEKHMREIQAAQITEVVARLCIEANEHLPEDVKCAIKNCRACEDWEIAQGVLDKIIENFYGDSLKSYVNDSILQL